METFELLEAALYILAPSVLVIVSSSMIMKSMSRNLEKTLRSEILRQNNKDFVKLNLRVFVAVRRLGAAFLRMMLK
jgi:hypothetical protein